MKTKPATQNLKKVQEEEAKTCFAKFGQSGKEVTVECVKEDGKYVGIHGEIIPAWASISER